MNTITLDDNQQLEAYRWLKLDNFGACGFVNVYVKHVRNDRAALENQIATLLEEVSCTGAQK